MEPKSVASWSALISAHVSLGIWCECHEILGDLSREGCCRAEESMLFNVLSSCTHLGALDLGSVMISGLTLHVCGLEALKVSDDVLEQGLKPDDVAYICMLSACSHTGLVKEGLQCFERMKVELGIVPSTLGCMVDLMGRAGKLNDAYAFIKNIPMEPNGVLWHTILGACKVHQNVEMGETES
ncbi:tetratricopeptide repeat (TPR)-like superfamily protein [Actinidia rufa]|uniref:Tetratricopeptide repeat (TPR)-like superfamily protein n=1 Tax=Actinidia rufa TaxID=165716 RepID=A0A7J0DVM3_9ERIC|nr:tetratricopeptide repeat (TPR)-like superfamily protein [Actinidia rufa]